MKTTKTFLGFIALLAVIGLTITACSGDIPNNTDWSVKAKDKSGNVLLYSSAEAKVFQKTIPDGTVVKDVVYAMKFVAENGWYEYRYKVEYEGSTYYINEKDLHKITKASKDLRKKEREAKYEKANPGLKEKMKMSLIVQLIIAVASIPYFIFLNRKNKSNASVAYKTFLEYYEEKRRQFPWLVKWLEKREDPAKIMAGKEQEYIVTSIIIFVILALVAMLFFRRYIVVVIALNAFAFLAIFLFSRKGKLNPAALESDGIALECPSCHCPHSWGIVSEQKIIDSIDRSRTTTTVTRTNQLGWETTEEKTTKDVTYGGRIIKNFECENCGYTYTQETGESWDNEPDQGLKYNNPPDKGYDIPINYSGVYEGDMVNGKRHGKGKLTDYYDNVYEGDFVNGAATGKVKITYKDGKIYEGDVVDGEPDGKGIYHLKDGSVYEGDIVNGYFHGKGKMTYSSGKVKEGNWEKNDFIGENEPKSLALLAKISAKKEKKIRNKNEPRNGFVSFLFGLVVTFGLLVITGMILEKVDFSSFISDFQLVILPKIFIFIAVLIAGLIITYKAWRYKKYILFFILLALSVIGWLYVFDIKLSIDHLIKGKITFQSTAEINNEILSGLSYMENGVQKTVVIKNEWKNKGGTPLNKETKSKNGEIKLLKIGDILTVTGNITGKYLPVEHQGAKGFVNIDYIGLPEKWNEE